MSELVHVPAAASQLEAMRSAIAELPDVIAELETAGDYESLARGLAGLRSLRRDLGFVERLAEQACAATLPDNKTEVDGLGVVQRRRAMKRTEWRHDELIAEVCKAGVYGQSLLDVFSPSWKVTGLREMGVDPGEFCREEPGVASIQIHGGPK